MEQVMNLLSEVEEKATKILNLAEEEKKRLRVKSIQDMEDLDKQIKEATKEKLDALRSKNDKELLEGKQSLMEECQKSIQRMEDNYKDNHKKIVDQIFHQIIGE